MQEREGSQTLSKGSGQGVPERIAAPESANNAGGGAFYVPLPGIVVYQTTVPSFFAFSMISGVSAEADVALRISKAVKAKNISKNTVNVLLIISLLSITVALANN